MSQSDFGEGARDNKGAMMMAIRALGQLPLRPTLPVPVEATRAARWEPAVAAPPPSNRSCLVPVPVPLVGQRPSRLVAPSPLSGSRWLELTPAATIGQRLLTPAVPDLRFQQWRKCALPQAARSAPAVAGSPPQNSLVARAMVMEAPETKTGGIETQPHHQKMYSMVFN